MRRLLDQLFAERTLSEWEEVLSRQDGQWDVFLPAGRIRYDEQVQANEFAQEIENDQGGKLVLVPAPAQFDGVVSQLRNAPKLGADTDEVLRRLGRERRRDRRATGGRRRRLMPRLFVMRKVDSSRGRGFIGAVGKDDRHRGEREAARERSLIGGWHGAPMGYARSRTKE